MKLYIDEFFTKGLHGIRTSKATIVNGIAIGVSVGLLIAAYDWLITDICIRNFKLIPSFWLGILPFLGMVLTGLLVKYFKIKSTSMADEIVFAYHTDVNNIETNKFTPKLFASITTIGFGGSAGMEGASKWVGAVTGLILQKTINRFKFLKKFEGGLTNAMMTGASAGIAAIFKAPLSGTIMALESPYKKDLAHEPMVQSFLGAIASYAVFTSIRGSQKFFPINVQYTLKWSDILISAVIGLISGLFSLYFLKLFILVKERIDSMPLMSKYIIGGIFLSLIAYAGLFLFAHYVTLFGGNDVINNIFNNQYGLRSVYLVAFFKSLAIIITFAFGGIGGLFLPSATIGACLGLLCQLIFHFATPGIFPFIGIASFIAASYNGLLFGPVLIAEISGESSLVVLGIVASTIAYLISNGVSNSSNQKEHR